MEEVMAALRSIQKELAEHKELIFKNGEDVTEKVTSNINIILEEKFSRLEQKYECLKSRVENQEQRLYYLERQARQRNLVFFGLEEHEKSYSNIENIIIDFVHKYFTLKIDSRDLQAIRRIGKKSDKPRPIVVTFSTLGKKIDILKNKGVLKNSMYYIKEDFPRSVLQIRRDLQEQVQAERAKGNKAVLKYDKLVILKNNTAPPQNNNKKRNLSKSPENNSTSSSNKNIQRLQANKKNKMVATHTTQRSSSFSEGVIKPGMINFLINKNSNNKNTTEDNTANA